MMIDAITGKLLYNLNKKCKCGCDQKIIFGYSTNQKFIPGHYVYKRKNPQKLLTYDIVLQNYELIKTKFEEKFIEMDEEPINKNVKDKCITRKPQRGTINGSKKSIEDLV